LLAVLGAGMASASPLCAQAQRRVGQVIGYLYFGSEGRRFLDAFRKGLNETGYIEGQNVQIELQVAQNGPELPKIVADLVRRRVAVIVTPGSLTAALAAKAATSTIPIVFGIGGDPVATGLVSRLNHPDGNLTGVTFLNVELVPKRLEFLSKIAPDAKRFAVLMNSNSAGGDLMLRDLREAASSIGRRVEAFYVATADQIGAAFANLAQEGTEALLVNPDILFANNSAEVVELALRYRIPAIYGGRVFTEVGGLMSYGDKRSESFRQMGLYTGRILQGEKPANLPVTRPTSFELVINLQAAKRLGLTVPPTLLAFANETIE
jgi:putative ABC transport system substrate-binding protein